MLEVPYSEHTYRIPSTVLPGNDTSQNPLEFDLAPAWGPDWARIKSIIYATVGLTSDGDWSPEMQNAVIAGYETGAGAFINTVDAIRGLTVPAKMALRAGIITAERYDPKQPKAQVAITTGLAFSRIVGALPVIGLCVASEIAKLSQKAEGLDSRFFAQPSGSGGAVTSERTPSNAKAARRTSRRRGTAANQGQTVSPPAGMSSPSQ